MGENIFKFCAFLPNIIYFRGHKCGNTRVSLHWRQAGQDAAAAT
jgi:hypothetical protein